MLRYLLLFVLVSGLAQVALGHHKVDRVKDVPMVLIPEGPFLMGSAEGKGRADEHPQRTVYLSAYYIDTFEVTNREYLEYLAASGRKEPFNAFGDGPLSEQKNIGHLPVVQVTWNDAEDYCYWAGKRLPTEAEWEKAARGSDGRTYPWGNTAPTKLRANYDRNWDEGQGLHSPGSLPDGTSPYGVYDMSGNVREWVQDWYAEDYYSHASGRDPKGADSGILKVIRGGSWHSFDHDIRTTARGKGGFALKTHGIGFRCAKDAEANTNIQTKAKEK